MHGQVVELVLVADRLAFGCVQAVLLTFLADVLALLAARVVLLVILADGLALTAVEVVLLAFDALVFTLVGAHVVDLIFFTDGLALRSIEVILVSLLADGLAVFIFDDIFFSLFANVLTFH